DEAFIFHLYSMLRPGGIAFLTTDYYEGWHAGVPKPGSDVRLYSSERLRRLARLLPEGSLLDPPTWGASEPYFEIAGARYAFCSFAFMKRSATALNEHCAELETFLKSRSVADGEWHGAMEIRALFLEYSRQRTACEQE